MDSYILSIEKRRSDPEIIVFLPYLLPQLSGLYSAYIYFRNCFGSSLCFMQRIAISQMNKISILQLQVSMTIKTKHSSAPTWYLMANAAAAYNSSIFIPTLFCRTEPLYFSKASELLLQ